MSMNKSKNTSTTKYTDVIIKNLTFTEMKETERTKGQKIAFPNYISASGESKMLYIQLPEIMLEMYGVPKLGDYYKDDVQRSFIKLPLNQSIKEIQDFSKMIKDLDMHLSSETFKEKIFGSKSKKYKYQSIFRLPNDPNDDDEDKSKKNSIPRIPYMKLKLNTTYPTGEIITTVFLKNKIKNEYKPVDDITDINSFCKYVCYQSKLKAIISPVKLWAQPITIKDPSYGVTFKILKVQVDPPVNTSLSMKDYLNNTDGFLNSDSEDEIQNKSSSSHDTKNIINTDKKKIKDDDTDNDKDAVKNDDKEKVKDIKDVEEDEDDEDEEEDDQESD